MFDQRPLRSLFPQPKHIPLYMSTIPYPGSVGPGSDEDKADPIRAPRRHRVILMSGGARLLLVALVAGFVPQFRQRQITTADTNQLAIPTVAVISPTVAA